MRPYSKYQVGAALLAPDGKIYTGCNVENASYGLALCAERSAVASLIVTGERSMKALVVVTAGARTGCPLRSLPADAVGICPRVADWVGHRG